MQYFQNSRRRSIPSPSVSRLSPGYFPGNYNCPPPPSPSFDQIPGSKSAILITHWRGARHPLFRLRKSAIFKSFLTRKSVILSVTLKSTIWIAPREGNDPPFWQVVIRVTIPPSISLEKMSPLCLALSAILSLSLSYLFNFAQEVGDIEPLHSAVVEQVPGGQVYRLHTHTQKNKNWLFPDRPHVDDIS